jgi:hypothetical protein
MPAFEACDFHLFAPHQTAEQSHRSQQKTTQGCFTESEPLLIRRYLIALALWASDFIIIRHAMHLPIVEAPFG